ncbi:MAG: epimerase [Cyclobacteriaceae bacterium]|nr:epimerase [Cyclobacteriaceae bacterium]
MKKVIITGTTGMVGKGVLLECLESAAIEKVLVINRSSIKIEHPKLEEIILPDFLKVDTIKTQMKGYDACFYCMGISSIGMNEATYTKITFETTKAFADVLYEVNPRMVFNYVSGQGTDGTEKGNIMWARVKGKTENMILNKGFKDAYAIRLGGLLPEKGIKSKTSLYNAIYSIIRPFIPLFRNSPSIINTSRFGKAMINTLIYPSINKVLTNKDLNLLAAR